MEERRTANRITAHMDAARRLRAGIERHPEARHGLTKCLRFHTRRACQLASEICAGAGCNGLAPVNVSAPT